MAIQDRSVVFCDYCFELLRNKDGDFELSIDEYFSTMKARKAGWIVPRKNDKLKHKVCCLKCKNKKKKK